MNKPRKKLGELLMDAGLIDDMQLKAALSHQKEWGERLGTVLIRKGFIGETEMMAVIGEQMGMPCLPLEQFERPSDEVISRVKEETARRFGILPQRYDGKTLTVVTSDPTDLKTLDDLAFLLGVRVKALLALDSDIHLALDHFYDPFKAGEKLARRTAAAEIRFTPKDEKFELMQGGDAGNDAINSTDKPAGALDHDVLGSLVDLLVEKGIFTLEELAERINLRRG